MKTPCPQSRDGHRGEAVVVSRSPAAERRLRSQPRRNPRRLRRPLFEQFEDRRVLATAIDDEYMTFQNQPLVITPDGAWSNDTIQQSGCVDEIPESWDGSWDYSEWEGNWVYGYWDVNNNYHEEGVPEEYHPAECVESGWVPMSPDNATGDIVTWPQGSLTDLVQGARAFIYTPPANFIGTDSFTYWIDDEKGDPDYATVTIIVNAPNVPPQTNNDPGYSTNEDTLLLVGGAGVVANDTDANGDTLTAVLVSNATRGFVSLNSNGTFTYTPYENEYGPDSFTYKAYDGQAYGNIATVSLHVDPVNDPPVAFNNSYLFVQDIPRLINFLADDTDIDNSALIPIYVSHPLHGSLIQYLDGTFAYAPAPGYVGPDSFTYQASDGQNSSNVATVTIQVKADGVELLADIMPGTSSSGAWEKEMMGGALYFNAASPSGGQELWKTDGTAAGTVQVKDIVPGSGNSSPWRLTNVNGTLFFTAIDGVHGRELWKSDGTEAGTVLVKDIREGAADSDPLFPTFYNVNGTLFFFANDGIHGLELWKSDGTEAGTVLVKDITPGSAGTSWWFNTGPGNVNDGFRVIGNTLYFAIIDGTSAQLWKSDGTESGTVLVKDFGTNTGLDGLTNLNGTLIFSTHSATGGAATSGKLWKSDGTTAGTTPLYEFQYSARSFTVVNNKVFFHATNATTSGLWVTDGYSANFVHSVTLADGTEWNGFSAAIGNTLYFQGANSQGSALWRSDGTASGTYKVKDVVPDHMAVANGKLYFRGNDGISGYEPWVSDGTSSGTKLLKDLEPGNSMYSGVLDLINFNGSVVFSAFNTANGWEPWILRVVNHPPAGTNKTIGIIENATYTLSAASFGFTDPNDSPPHTLAAVKIASLPALGTLSHNGSAVILGQTIPVAHINSGQLRYAPPPGQTGSNLASFEFQVQDNGGTADYGGDLDVWPNTFNFNVSPATTDLALTSFTTSGTGLSISYTITQTVATDFTIALYASDGGSTQGQLLQTVTPPADYKTAGPHTINFTPTFTDPASDYYLVAVLDASGVVGETNETNNSAQFSGGLFVAQEAGGRDVVHIIGGATADAAAATVVNTSTLRITHGGQTTDLVLADFDHIHFRGHEGNDSLIADEALALQLWAFGGDGDDSLTGGALGDTLVGGDGHDAIFGGAGIDWLLGSGGNDTLDGGGDSDVIEGNDGTDTLTGGSGNDDLFGGSGDDSVAGGDGYDDVFGNDGNDSLDGGGDSDNITGGGGNDSLDGGDGADSMTGGAGNDHVSGGSGNDSLHGNDGNDTVTGGDGDDSIEGGSGHDSLSVNKGSDDINGDDGHDYLDGGDGHDSLNGGNGTDTIYSANGGDQVFSSGGNDSVNGSGGVTGCSEPPSGGWTIEDFCRPLVVFQGLTASGGGYEGGSVVVTLQRYAWALYEYTPYQGELHVTIRIAENWQDTPVEPATRGVDFTSPLEFVVTIPENEPSAEFTIPLLVDSPLEPIEGFSAEIVDIEGLPFDGTGDVSRFNNMGILDSTVEAFDDVLAPSTGPLTFSPVANDKSGGNTKYMIDPALKLSVESFSQPAHGGTVERNPDPRFADYSLIYTPNPNYTGDDSFTYTATNGYQSDEATVHFTAGPSVSVADATAIVEDGEEGVPAVARFRVWLSEPHPVSVSVEFNTIDLPSGDEEAPEDRARARESRDYTKTSVPVIFNPGQTEKWVEVPIHADNIDEYSEPFSVELSSPSNTVLGQATATALITDDDDEPELSIAGTGVEEPADETTEARLLVTLSHGTEKEATVTYITEELPEPDPEEEDWLPATTDEDFTATESTVDVPTDDLTFEISIDILADEESEPDEKFSVTLVSAQNATLSEEEGESDVTIGDSVGSGSGSITNAVYGWEGGDLNLYLKASSGELEITKYELDVDNDGTYDYATTAIEDDGSVLKFNLELLGMLGNPVEDGNYAAKVRVTTSDDATAEYPIQITVGNTPPAIEFGEDIDGDPGVPFVLDVSTFDPGPDTVTQIEIAWGDGATSTVTGGSGMPGHIYAETGHYIIRATATDEDDFYWAELEIDIGDTNQPIVDDGSPEIIATLATLLPNGNASLAVEAEDDSGSSNLTYAWDLDGDGEFETSGSSTIELAPGEGAIPYSASVRITDTVGRSIEAFFQFTEAGNPTPEPTRNTYGENFKKLTRDLPDEWRIHHTLQVDRPSLVLEQRFLEKGINIHRPEYLRGVPKDVHDEITALQIAWWKEVAKEPQFQNSVALAKQKINLDRVIAHANEIEEMYKSRWIKHGPNQARNVTRIKNLLKNGAVAWGMAKGSRWSRLLPSVLAALPIVAVLTSNAEAAYQVKEFDPDTHQPFKKFMQAYEACLEQAVTIGRVRHAMGSILVVEFGNFARSIKLDQEAVAICQTELGKWVDTHLLP